MGGREEEVAAGRSWRRFRLPGSLVVVVAAAAAGRVYFGLLVFPLVDVLPFHRASRIAAAG